MLNQPRRIAVVQFAPLIENVEANIRRATELTNSLQPGTVDLVCLPEMIFTGYSFPDLESIKPFLEVPDEGPTFTFCSTLARRLGCYVTAGYPEKLALDQDSIASSPPGSIPPIAANAALLVSPDGALVGNYQKTNLFEYDKSWAQAGPGFSAFPLGPPFNTNLCLAICMDLNPQPPTDWTYDGGPYELASFVRGSKDCQILVLLCAWLDQETHLESSRDIDTINYWIARLRPLWDQSIHDAGSDAKDDDVERIVVICNRNGLERGNLFAGCSMMMKLRRSAEGFEVVGIMRRKEEGVNIWTV